MATYTYTQKNGRLVTERTDELNTTFVVYSITNIISKKIYIGQTIQCVGRRWRAHLLYMKKGKSNLKSALCKYGIENFVFEIIEKVETQEQLDAQEVYWIKEFNTQQHGYNLTSGGNGGKKFGEETVERMRVSANMRFAREGRTVVPESEEEREVRHKLWRDGSRQRQLGNTYKRGTKSSEETKMKISKAKLGNKTHNRPVRRSDGKEYPSVLEAAEDSKISRWSVIRSATGKQKSLRCGWTFIYLPRVNK